MGLGGVGLVGYERPGARLSDGALGQDGRTELGQQRGGAGSVEAGSGQEIEGGMSQSAPPTAIFADWVPCGWLSPQP